jgi:beta-1,4-N-acetylglucosaminyltransferase
MTIRFFGSVIISLGVIWLFRLLWIIPSLQGRFREHRKLSAKIVIVLGSGGHTAEMLRLIESLDFDKYSQRIYIISSGDTLSESKARAFELQKQSLNPKSVSRSLSTYK